MNRYMHHQKNRKLGLPPTIHFGFSRIHYIWSTWLNFTGRNESDPTKKCPNSYIEYTNVEAISYSKQ